MLAIGSSFVASRLAVPVYRTTATVIVSQVIQSRDPDPSDIYASQQLAQTYVQLVKREPILSSTIAALGMSEDWQSLRGRVSVMPVAGTQLLEISVLDTSPQWAKAVADELARQLILQSPTTPSPEDQERLDFVQAQLPELEAKIKSAQEGIARLDQAIAGATSARQIAVAQEQQAVLQAQINQWQTTYAQLLTTLQKGNLNYISVVEPAELPRIPVSPRVGWNMLLAGVLGLTLSVGAVFLLESLDDSIRTPDEARALTGAPVLAAIARIEGDSYSDKLVAEREPRSPITEAYCALRTNLQFLSIDAPFKTIVVTSPGLAEGKSVTSANLAVVLAQAGLSVILVDADLRRPVLHKIFGLKTRKGLSTWLIDQKGRAVAAMDARFRAAPDTEQAGTLNAYLQPTRLPGLQVMTSGSLYSSPAEILGSVLMGRFVKEVAQAADVVILDSPPCVTIADAMVLGHWADGVLLVLDSQRTNRQSVRLAKERLEAVGAKICGVLINRVNPSADGYHYYSSYWQHADQAVAARQAPSGSPAPWREGTNPKTRHDRGNGGMQRGQGTRDPTDPGLTVLLPDPANGTGGRSSVSPTARMGSAATDGWVGFGKREAPDKWGRG